MALHHTYIIQMEISLMIADASKEHACKEISPIYQMDHFLCYANSGRVRSFFSFYG